MVSIERLRLRYPQQHALLKLCLDVGLWTLVTPIAFWVRLDQGWADHVEAILLLMAMGVPLKTLTAYVFGFHRRSWYRVSLRDLLVLAQGVGLVTFVFATLAYGGGLGNVPRSVPLIEGMLALLALGAARLAARLAHETYRQQQAAQRGVQRVVIAGAGEAGTLVARELLRHPEAGAQPVAFVDDDPSKHRRRFVGLPVAGAIGDLPQVASRHGADTVIIAMPAAGGQVVRRVVEEARRAGLSHRTIPGMFELLSGRVSIGTLRNVDLEDLLRRAPVELDACDIARYLEGRTVLVTGAGGSIGSEIVRQVAAFAPRRMLLLGRGENGVYEIERECRRRWPRLEVVPLVCDVRQRRRLEHLFARYRPEVVFHAAAHKHVPLMEANAEEAVLNNVGGTRNLVEVALGHGVLRFVNISTDKAVNPTSVMGATKRVAELLVEQAARRAEGHGRSERHFVSVRFGNVLGSRGSVVPLFKEQIQQGGPVTVTHPEMERYFMTIPEATQLVLQAGGLGGNGRVYVLDMGAPVRIEEMARDLIRLSGLEPGRDVAIAYSGLRPGEKLFEELLTAEEGTEASPHAQIFVARVGTRQTPEAVAAAVERLLAAAERGEGPRMRALLAALVPTHQLQGVAPQAVAAAPS